MLLRGNFCKSIRTINLLYLKKSSLIPPNKFILIVETEHQNREELQKQKSEKIESRATADKKCSQSHLFKLVWVLVISGNTSCLMYGVGMFVLGNTRQSFITACASFLSELFSIFSSRPRSCAFIRWLFLVAVGIGCWDLLPQEAGRTLPKGGRGIPFCNLALKSSLMEIGQFTTFEN